MGSVVTVAGCVMGRTVVVSVTDIVLVDEAAVDEACVVDVELSTTVVTVVVTT